MSLSIRGVSLEYDYDDLNDYEGDIYDWLEDSHPRRGDIKIKLTSPQGTKSILLPYRNYDFINAEGYDDWPFMSVHFWGENPNGTWTLNITYKSGSGYVSMSGLSMTLYGTATIPTAVSSIPSVCHSSCVRGCFGEGPEHCDSCQHFRIASTLECVDQCPSHTHAYKSYCYASEGPNSTEIPTGPDEVHSTINIGPTVTLTGSDNGHSTTGPTVTPTSSDNGHSTTGPAVTPTSSDNGHSTTGPAVTPTSSDNGHSTTGPAVTPTSSDNGHSITGPAVTPTSSDNGHSTTGPAVIPTSSDNGHSTTSPIATPTVSEKRSLAATSSTITPTHSDDGSSTTGPTVSPTGSDDIPTIAEHSNTVPIAIGVTAGVIISATVVVLISIITFLVLKRRRKVRSDGFIQLLPIEVET